MKLGKKMQEKIEGLEKKQLKFSYLVMSGDYV